MEAYKLFQTNTDTCSYHMVVLQLSSCCQLNKRSRGSVALSNRRIHAVALASGHGRGRIVRSTAKRVTLSLEQRYRSLTLDQSTCIHERSNV